MKRWTTEERITIWRIYILGQNIPSAVHKMTIAVNRSSKSCASEIWKLHCRNPDSKVVYYDKGGREEVKLWGRGGEPWTSNEKRALRSAYDAMMPLDRIAELLGRKSEEVHNKYNDLVNKGRRPFGLI